MRTIRKSVLQKMIKEEVAKLSPLQRAKLRRKLMQERKREILKRIIKEEVAKLSPRQRSILKRKLGVTKKSTIK